MSKNIYDELFLPAEEIKQVAAEARDRRRLSELQWLSNHINFKAKQEGKFSTTFVTDSFIISDEDLEQLRNKGYHITLNHADETTTISWG